MARWPGKIEAGSVSNEIISHLDWMPTLMAAAGEPELRAKLLKGYKANGKKYKVHLDGYNFLPYLTGKEKKGPREEFFYFSDDGDLLALRYRNWKVHFMVQDQAGTLEIWQREFRGLRMPLSRRAKPAKPARPRPRSDAVAGSGVGNQEQERGRTFGTDRSMGGPRSIQQLRRQVAGWQLGIRNSCRGAGPDPAWSVVGAGVS